MSTLTDLHCHVDIRASASRVWSVLSDLDRYAEWNPWIRRASGRLATGACIEVWVASRDTDGEPTEDDLEALRPQIERLTPVSTLVAGIDWADVEGRRTRHEFRIEPIRSGTRLHQSHSVVSPGVGRPDDPLAPLTVEAVTLMNEALKTRAER